MANYKKPAIIMGLLVAVGGMAAVAVPLLSPDEAKASDKQVFGISDKDLVFPFMRQGAWKETAPGQYTVSPPRPNAAFSNYAVSFDKHSSRICAVYATTDDLAAIKGLPASPEPQISLGTDAEQHQLKWAFAEDCN